MNELIPTTLPLNITWSGQNGDLDDIPRDLTDAYILAAATMGVREGLVAGIEADPGADLSDFVVERFATRLMVRPKTPFGGNHA